MKFPGCVTRERVLPHARMAYQEPAKRSIRLDDDVYEALRKLPESPNKFLRKVLSARGAFDPPSNTIMRADEVIERLNRKRSLWFGSIACTQEHGQLKDVQNEPL